MKIIKRIGIGILAILLILIAVFIYSINTHVSIGKYEDWYVEPSENIANDAVTVQFVGVSTLVISDDSTTIMTDGFFTRPKAMDMLFGEIEPEVDEITWSLEKLALGRLDAIFVVHSHFDHAMDAPEVAKQTGAIMYGSESTANIGRGWNLDEKQINVFENGEAIQIGKFKITPILSNHYEFANPKLKAKALGGNQEITEPLIPPAKTMDYKMGGAYTFLFEHPKGSFVLQSSAGWKENSLDSIKTDIVLLGIGGLGAQTEAYQAKYFEEIVDKLGANQVYPIHWDAFVGTVRQPLKGPILLSDWIAGKTIKGFEAVEREVDKRENVQVNLLPQWDKVVLFE